MPRGSTSKHLHPERIHPHVAHQSRITDHGAEPQSARSSRAPPLFKFFPSSTTLTSFVPLLRSYRYKLLNGCECTMWMALKRCNFREPAWSITKRSGLCGLCTLLRLLALQMPLGSIKCGPPRRESSTTSTHYSPCSLFLPLPVLFGCSSLLGYSGPVGQRLCIGRSASFALYAWRAQDRARSLKNTVSLSLHTMQRFCGKASLTQ